MNSYYDFLNRRKRQCIRWGGILAVATVVSGVLQYRPLAQLIARKLVEPRPVLTVTRLLAKENQAAGIYPTAVRVDEEFAAKCYPVDEYGDRPRSIVSPIPTFTEFVISERHQKVCLIISVEQNSELPKNAVPLYKEILKSQYVAIFGYIHEGIPMYRVFSDMYDLSNLQLERLMQDNPPFPDLRNFHRDAPRAFPYTQEYEILQLHAENKYQSYLKGVKEELRRPGMVARSVFGLMAICCGVGFMFCYLAVLNVHRSYSREMHSLGLPGVRLKDFLFVGDLSTWSENMQEQRRSVMRADSLTRAGDLRVSRRQRVEDLHESNTADDPETPEQRQAKRRRNIEKWCGDLREIAPPEAKDETEFICSRAIEFLAQDYDQARRFLTGAIEWRKKMNAESQAPKEGGDAPDAQ